MEGKTDFFNCSKKISLKLILCFVQVPSINFASVKLEELTDLGKNELEPPLTSKLTEDQLNNFLMEPFMSSMPCSTTEVERVVQVTLHLHLHLHLLLHPRI